MNANAPPVAVFLCRCFGEVDAVLELDSLAGRLASDRVQVAVVDGLCLPENRMVLVDAMRQSGLKNCLLGACARRARGGMVLENLAARSPAGVASRLVDLREGCAWIHADAPVAAREKAVDLLQMGLASFRHPVSRPVFGQATRFPEALVVGAGPAGLAAAGVLSNCGIQAHVVERSSRPGGLLKALTALYPENRDPAEVLTALLEPVTDNPRLTMHLKCRIESVTESPSGFHVSLSGSESRREIHAGAVILACGAQPVIPRGVYGYGALKQVVTQMALERQFAEERIEDGPSVFIQCVLSRCRQRPYCSTICCPSALKNAARLAVAGAGRWPVTVLHRDIATPGAGLEEEYRRAMRAGVRFIRYGIDNPPKVVGNGRVEAVEVLDTVSGRQERIEASRVILSMPLAPHDASAVLAAQFGVRIDEHGFFSGQEPMHPLETGVPGVWICGSARWPVSSRQAETQGQGAAAKAVAFLRDPDLRRPRDPLGQPVDTAVVDPNRCTGCGQCAAVCPRNAIRMLPSDRGPSTVVDTVRCSGCGACAAVCPVGAVDLYGETHRGLREMVKRAFA